MGSQGEGLPLYRIWRWSLPAGREAQLSRAIRWYPRHETCTFVALGKLSCLRSSDALLVATCGQLVARAKEKGQGNYSPDLRFHGRDDWIRTSGLTVPNRARYQTAPRPDIVPYVNSPEGTSPVSPNDRLRTPVDRPSTPCESVKRQRRKPVPRGFCGHVCGHAVAHLWPTTHQRAVYLRLLGFGN